MPDIATSQLDALIHDINDVPRGWEQLAAIRAAMYPVQTEQRETPNVQREATLLAARDALRSGRESLLDADPDDRQFLDRFAVDLLAAHRQPGNLPYHAAAGEPHASVVTADPANGGAAIAAWHAWYGATRDGASVTSALDRAMAAAHLVCSDPLEASTVTMELVSRWRRMLGELRVGYSHMDDDVLVIYGWRDPAPDGRTACRFAAAVGRFGAHDTDGTAVLTVPPLVSRWAHRHTTCRDQLRVLADADAAEIARLLTFEQTSPLLTELWQSNTEPLDHLEELHTLPHSPTPPS